MRRPASVVGVAARRRVRSRSAKAAAELADICSYGSDYLQISTRTPDEEREIRAWISSIAFDALTNAIAEATQAYRAECAAEKAVA